MAAFGCKNCGFDLSLRVDLIARAMKEEYKDEAFPTDVSVDGCCDKCKAPFHYSGGMFAKFLEMKAEEGIINSRANDFLIVEFDVGAEEMRQIKDILKDGDQEALQALMIRLLADGERPDK